MFTARNAKESDRTSKFGSCLQSFHNIFFFRFITVLTVKLYYSYKYQCRCEIVHNCHVTNLAFCIKGTELQRQSVVQVSHDTEFQDFVIRKTELIPPLLAPTSTMLETELKGAELRQLPSVWRSRLVARKYTSDTIL
jgi:hypothetical protein